MDNPQAQHCKNCGTTLSPEYEYYDGVGVLCRECGDDYERYASQPQDGA